VALRTIPDDEVITEVNAMRRACPGVNISEVKRDPVSGLVTGILIRPSRNLVRLPQMDDVHIEPNAGIYHLVLPRGVPDDHLHGLIDFAYGRHSRMRTA